MTRQVRAERSSTSPFGSRCGPAWVHVVFGPEVGRSCIELFGADVSGALAELGVPSSLRDAQLNRVAAMRAADATPAALFAATAAHLPQGCDGPGALIELAHVLHPDLSPAGELTGDVTPLLPGLLARSRQRVQEQGGCWRVTDRNTSGADRDVPDDPQVRLLACLLWVSRRGGHPTSGALYDLVRGEHTTARLTAEEWGCIGEAERSPEDPRRVPVLVGADPHSGRDQGVGPRELLTALPFERVTAHLYRVDVPASWAHLVVSASRGGAALEGEVLADQRVLELAGQLWLENPEPDHTLTHLPAALEAAAALV